MKIVTVLLFVFLLFNCSKKIDGVYWCGDHPCKNKHEKEKYFKENLVIEFKENDKKKNFFKKKPLKKISKKTFKKQILKKKKAKDKAIKKENKKVANNVNLDKYLDNNDNFEDIVEIIVTDNQKKPYPDINDFPED